MCGQATSSIQSLPDVDLELAQVRQHFLSPTTLGRRFGSIFMVLDSKTLALNRPTHPMLRVRFHHALKLDSGLKSVDAWHMFRYTRFLDDQDCDGHADSRDAHSCHDPLPLHMIRSDFLDRFMPIRSISPDRFRRSWPEMVPDTERHMPRWIHIPNYTLATTRKRTSVPCLRQRILSTERADRGCVRRRPADRVLDSWSPRTGDICADQAITTLSLCSLLRSWP